jgi:hypothetical protein
MESRAVKKLLPMLDGRELVLADVGAAGGLNRTWEKLLSHATIIGFEPDERSRAHLASWKSASGVVFLGTALAGRRGMRPLATWVCP